MTNAYMRVKGSKHFRHRLMLATLSSTPLIVEEIRSDDSWPGLRPHEVSFLRLLESISDDCTVEINETGTKLKYKPAVLIGGKNLIHDCGLSRSIGYFLEPLAVLGLFGKKPLSITLRGITNGSKDPSVDTFRTTTLHMLKHFGVPLEGLELRIVSRGAPPQGGGEVVLGIPAIQNSLSAVTWVDEGMVKSIRGVTFSTRVSPQIENRMIYAARGVFNRLIPDVHIFTDHKTGPQSGRISNNAITQCRKKPTQGVVQWVIVVHLGPSKMAVLMMMYQCKSVPPKKKKKMICHCGTCKIENLKLFFGGDELPMCFFKEVDELPMLLELITL